MLYHIMPQDSICYCLISKGRRNCCWRILRRLLFFTFRRKRFDNKEREREKDIVHSLLWTRLTKKFGNFYELNHPKTEECLAINCSLSCLIPPDIDQKQFRFRRLQCFFGPVSETEWLLMKKSVSLEDTTQDHESWKEDTHSFKK